MLPIENHFAEVSHSERRHRELLHLWMNSEGQKIGYALRELGRVADLPINLIYPVSVRSGPRLLIAAAFHGEEPSGAWGILKFLMQDSARLTNVNLSFIPIVNPSGFMAASRYNHLGQNPNSGFVPDVDDSEPSQEGKVLLANIDQLIELGSDGFLALHEDWEQSEAYLYSFEKANKPGDFSFALRNALAAFFPIMSSERWEGHPVEAGIVFNHSDGSFEDRLFRSGVPRTACTETPGTEPASRQIACNCRIIEEFADYHLKLPS